MVLIRIDHPQNAKRIAFEASRNLAMVGYTATAKSMPVGGHQGKMMDAATLSRAFVAVANGSAEPRIAFDWNLPCTCPDNGVAREDCTR